MIGKAEHLTKGSNPRFVVTSLSCDEYDAATVYEKEYCARGDMENRIKEQQLYLFADRTSASTMRANQLRLWLSSVAYVLVNALRELALQGTELEKAQCHTIRLKLRSLPVTHSSTYGPKCSRTSKVFRSCDHLLDDSEPNDSVIKQTRYQFSRYRYAMTCAKTVHN